MTLEEVVELAQDHIDTHYPTDRVSEAAILLCQIVGLYKEILDVSHTEPPAKYAACSALTRIGKLERELLCL